jgi:pyruvate formate lyase activating enzyme
MTKTIDYEQTGIVFNIQKFSVHDGPGIRSIVFFKGCPLSCKWCSNPESQAPQPVVMLNARNCLKCGRCLPACPRGALDYSIKGYIDRQRCVDCGRCASVCYARALVVSGQTMSVAEVVAEIKKDAIHYRRSNGGITLSGGEPLLQANFAGEILKASQAHGWHTAIETTGFATEESLLKVIPYVDLVLLDMKQIDAGFHKQGTGISNEVILRNALRIAAMAKELVVRVPVIPGFNDDARSIRLICEFAKYLKGVKEIHLLPYHKLGANKYESLGREFPMDAGAKSPTEAEIQEYRKLVASQEFHCVIGGA